MKIALHDSDSTRFPNLALMKLSAFHKAKGDTVERFLPLAAHTYDIVYSSAAVKAIRHHGGKQYNFSCYVLVQEIGDALERVEFLRALKVDPFAQPYRKPGSKALPAKPLRDFARWVNHKAIFKSVPWAKYRGSAA